MIDLSLLRDRALCRLFGHPGPHPLDLDLIRLLAPWARPRCRRCGTRLSR